LLLLLLPLLLLQGGCGSPEMDDAVTDGVLAMDTITLLT